MDANAEATSTAEQSEDQRAQRVQAAVHTDKKLPSMSLEEKCDFFDGYRVMGNTFYEEGRYDWARLTYMEAVTAIKYGIFIGCDDGPDGDVLRLGGGQRPLPQPAAQLMATLLLNAAQCYLMEGDGKKALECCDKAEAVDCAQPPSFTSKVYFRRGEALRQIGDIHSAYAHLLRACRLMPQNASCRAAMEKVKKEMRDLDMEELQAEKQTWSGKLAAEKADLGENRDDVMLRYETPDASADDFDQAAAELARQQRRRESKSGFLGQKRMARNARPSMDTISEGSGSSNDRPFGPFVSKPSRSANNSLQPRSFTIVSFTPSAVLKLLQEVIFELWAIFTAFTRAIVSAWMPVIGGSPPLQQKRRRPTPPWR
jgi:tetratricopeptide (TPR) repeat protein